MDAANLIIDATGFAWQYGRTSFVLERLPAEAVQLWQLTV